MLKKSVLALVASLGFSFAFAAVDINTATAQELEALKGIGPKTAAKIVQYREENGPFKSVDDLVKVNGIGPKSLAKFRDEASVGAAAEGKGAKPVKPTIGQDGQKAGDAADTRNTAKKDSKHSGKN